MSGDSSVKTSGEEKEMENLTSFSMLFKYSILLLICFFAFCIRLFAVVRYESVIHEFDPYFNFRTTKYLAHEGFLEFLDWFDDRGWYPLGRTIGGTIYPGLMLSASMLYWALNAINITINIRNVCVFLAPIFSAFAAIASYLLTKEVTKRSSSALLAAAFTAIVPSYISRSVGGSYDNEGVAIFALIFCFYLWVKSVNTGSMMWSCFCALSYYYMVAAWGGYVFIINVIPIYVVIMIVGGRYSSRLYIAYSVFYTMGSLMAMTVPFVGFNVIKQAECAASHGVFILLQVYAIILFLFSIIDAKTMQKMLQLLAFIVVGGVACALISLQLLGKVQWSGRSLTLLDPTYASKFIPIIASVSEHQPTSWTSFFFDLHILVPLAPVGLFFLFSNVTDGGIFIILYGTLAWYFAGVMVRLMLTLAPIACILSAIGISEIITRFSTLIKVSISKSLIFRAVMYFLSIVSGKKKPDRESNDKDNSVHGDDMVVNESDQNVKSYTISPPLSLFVIVGCLLLLLSYSYHATYVSSIAYSSPSIVIDAGQTPDGKRVLFDDYREAYFWLRQNTHPDAKILSWWDYGYQMSAMANRTVLVDNNTWNNTHIATVGRALASSEEDAYPILESLDVDYVLVIFGGLTGYSSDDINKFLWPVRIGGGVYPNDMPTEKEYFSSSGQFDIGPGGAPALLNCLAYKCCYYRFGQVQTDYGRPPGFDRARSREVGKKNIELSTIEEAFTSEHWIVRIYKVKHRANLQPTRKVAKQKKAIKRLYKKGSPVKGKDAKSTKSSQSKSSKGVLEDDSHEFDDETKYIGCFSSESMFSRDKIYDGGSTGANYNVALYHAKTNRKKYFAIARLGNDGHAFAFDALLLPEGNMGGPDCERPCEDMPNKFCGCSDGGCREPTPVGEEHNRRWTVYEVL